MAKRTVRGADDRLWVVSRTIQWDTPGSVDDFEHDVDGGRGAVFMIISCLILFWVLLVLWTPAQVHIPAWLWIGAVVILLFFPTRWYLRRPWKIEATTAGLGYGLPAEQWEGIVRGGTRAREEVRVVRNHLRQRATPGHADSPLQQVG